jgi:predicted RNase H-like nuclease (RuvC/YqgF family)
LRIKANWFKGNLKNNKLIFRETKLTESLHFAEDKINKMKIIIKTLSKEKNDMEELIMKQENKVSDLAAKIKIVEKNTKEKNKEIAENEENTMRLINILEEQKKHIENLSKNQANLPINKIVLSTRDEMQLKKIIGEKDNEITTLKVYNDNLKNDLHGKNHHVFFIQHLIIFLFFF